MRKGPSKKREREPDIKYQSVLISQFINYVMNDGKKSIAARVVYDAFDEAEKQLKKKAPEIMDQIITNVGPQMELRSRRIGGANYQVPYEVRADRRVTLAFRWVISAARARKGMPMSKRLALEFIDVCNNTGVAVKKRSDTHRMAEANRAFAHFAW